MEARQCNGFDRLFEHSVPHILERIFFFLDYESFKECHNVCMVWKRLLSSQTYCRRAKTVFSGEILKAELFKMAFFHWKILHLIVTDGD